MFLKSHKIHPKQTLYVFSFLCIFITSLNCEDNPREVAPTTVSPILPEVHTQPSEQLPTPASSSSPNFNSPFIKLPLVKITEIDKWLGFELSQNSHTTQNDTVKIYQSSEVKCDDMWSKYKKKIEDWPRKDTHANVVLYTYKKKINIIIIQFNEHICKKDYVCNEDDAPNPLCIPNLREICAGHKTRVLPLGVYENALSPLNRLLSECKIIKEENIERGYQCPAFALSHLKAEPGAIIRAKNSGSILEALKLPSPTLYVHHRTGIRPYGFNLIFYKDLSTLKNFIDFINNAIPKEIGSARHPCFIRM